ncbi:MAG TPA: hypothetical protein VG892_09980, partial [Terriglobales bacterium]|nr:hypothetical protein [Terriglobales bacterium]
MHSTKVTVIPRIFRALAIPVPISTKLDKIQQSKRQSFPESAPRRTTIVPGRKTNFKIGNLHPAPFTHHRSIMLHPIPSNLAPSKGLERKPPRPPRRCIA